MKATEIRNTLGIYDDDMLNAAVECERKDDLCSEIVRKILAFHGKEKLYGPVFRFLWVKEVLSNFGFDYVKADEKDESHVFLNKETGDEITIYPTCWFESQDALRFQNFLIY